MTRIKRCTARHPMHARQVRCELAAGHDDRHAHSFFARYWFDPAHVVGSITCDCGRMDSHTPSITYPAP